MNTRLITLSIGIAVFGFIAVAFPVFAGEIHTANYGAGFMPSPILQGETSTPSVHTANYGAGFAGSPNVIYANSPRRYGFYGAGYLPSPRIIYGFNWFNW
ncbi:MAG: hypothetical protein O3A36_00585 [bacterium]|nr:hypothetical protein [bacterium]